MRFKMEHKFDWPAEPIVEMLKNGEDLCPMEDLPNVTSRKILESRREGKKVYNRIEWCVHGQIPRIAQKILTPDMLTFEEHTVWDDDDCSFTTKIVPHYMKDKFKCNTKSKWVPDGENKTVRQFGGVLEARVPVVGQVVEKTIVNYLKKNNDQNAKLVKKFLKQRLGPPSDK